jgi:hypothetical protein
VVGRRRWLMRETIDGLLRIRVQADRTLGKLKAMTVRVNDHREREPGTVESIMHKVAPAIIGTASTAVLKRIARPAGSSRPAS